MNSWRNSYRRFGAAALIVLTVAACGASNSTWQPPAQGSGGPANPAASAAHVDLPTASGANASGDLGARATAGAQTVDNITATYTYRDNYITPLAHLYGKFLKSFVIVTLENKNGSDVKVVVSSEVSGYTDKATDTSASRRPMVFSITAKVEMHGI